MIKVLTKTAACDINLSKSEEKVIEQCRSMSWGEMIISFQNGEPVVIKTVKTTKLNKE